jgi:hypothetical protein
MTIQTQTGNSKILLPITTQTTTGMSSIINGPIDLFNPLYRLNQLGHILNFASVLANDATQYNYGFTSVTDDVIISQNIKQTLLELYFALYLNDYTEFLKYIDINSTDPEILNNTKLYLLKNSIRISAAKGVKQGIQKILELFAVNIGNFTFDIQSSPYNTNFVYRITTNLPKYYWTNILRPIVHPCSWYDEYVYVDTNSTLPNINVIPIQNRNSYFRIKQKNELKSDILSYTYFNNNPSSIFYTVPGLINTVTITGMSTIV